MATLRLIGYWRSGSQPDWPDPVDFVDPAWDDQERHMVWTYLKSGTVARAYRGLSRCGFCHEHNGSMEFTDGVYIWPQGLAHYLDAHAVRLPEVFVKHAVERLGALEAASVEHEWWKSHERL
jgi:hypothetical protein